jgi:protein-S-isoprenylcysteine O-methyltransferase Ste14
MSLKEKYVGWLLSMAGRRHGIVARLVGLAFGGTLFLVVVAWLLLIIAAWIGGFIDLFPPVWLNTAVGIISIALGGLLLAWSVWSQWAIGGGTPNPAVPTRRLMVKGAYKLCRNPLQLGVMIYYLGLGALLEDTVVGALMFLIAFALGAPYHKYVEEKELEARFGAEYEEYRRNTPFMIPRFRM